MNSMNQLMKSFVAVTVAAVMAGVSQAGVPLNNLEGVGGVAFNPLAYPAGQNKGSNDWEEIVSHPQLGTWYVRLGERDIDCNVIGGAVRHVAEPGIVAPGAASPETQRLGHARTLARTLTALPS